MPPASRSPGRIDFLRVADAARASLESLVAEWLPGGHRDGHEYKALNPTRGDSKIGSFSINLNTGAWGDFATNDAGGDAISLYAYLHNVSQLDAAKVLAQRLGILPAQGETRSATPAKPTTTVESTDPVVAPKRRSEWDPLIPAPPHAGDLPKAHLKRGKPEAMWEYRGHDGTLLGAVYRFRTSDGGKDVLPCVWGKHHETGEQKWCWLGFPEPRPLYGLDRLGDRPVLVVEGEKCADAARSVLPGDMAVITWPGGTKAVDKVDWTPLRGRKVIIWPDCDAQLDKAGVMLPEAEQPGVKAAERVAMWLHNLDCQVRIVAIPAPGAKPGGWDVADAIAEGWNPAQVRAFIRENLRRPACVETEPTPDQAAPAIEPPPWVRDGNGRLTSCMPNAFMALTNRPEWRNVLAFDEFAQRPVKRMPPPYDRGAAGDWEGMDDSFTAFWLATKAGMPKMSSMMAAEAAEMAARAAPFDPVREHLDALAWDKIDRADNWLSDFFGAPDNPYTRLVGRFWLIGLARRVFEPGCKFDYMPILEGPQGKGKSTALEILAGKEHFGNTDFVMGDKDSMAVMQGKLIYEIAELDSFNKADTTRVKSFVTRQVDEFRPAYGRRIVRMPRRVVLVGTTNQFEYFKDSTGNRRFWPIKCVEMINLDGLRAIRDQLLAEAVVLYRQGARTYPTREEQEQHFTPEQDSREIADAWEEGVHRFLSEVDASGSRPDHVSGYDILVKGLKIDAGKITKDMTQRIGIVMRKLKWTKIERRLENPRFVYERPQKSAHDTSPAQPEQGVPF